MRQNETGDSLLPVCKIHHKTMLIKTSQSWHKDAHLGPGSGLGSLEVKPHVWGQMTLERTKKGVEAIS